MKAKIRKTGEIVDVIAYSQSVNRNHDTDYVSYIDSKGIEHITERGLNFYWDFEPIESIDWEQRRYEIAKAVLHERTAPKESYLYDEEYSAQVAVEYADALIKELKNG